MELGASIKESKKYISSKVSTVTSSISSGVSSVSSFIVGTRHEVLTTVQVLEEEYKRIWGESVSFGSEQAYRTKVHEAEREQAALCLSGGGIRSAAFSLGVLQVLAKQGLLTKFHYLSLVSGGGYIGAWLSRWIFDAKNDAEAVERNLATDAGGSKICQISNLRANSNFLTPKTGITSADTWTGIVLWVRNVLLNWTVFIPALLISVLVPNVSLVVLALVQDVQPQKAMLFDYPLAINLLGVGLLCLTLATWQAARHLPRCAHMAPSIPISRMKLRSISGSRNLNSRAIAGLDII